MTVTHEEYEAMRERFTESLSRPRFEVKELASGGMGYTIDGGADGKWFEENTSVHETARAVVRGVAVEWPVELLRTEFWTDRCPLRRVCYSQPDAMRGYAHGR